VIAASRQPALVAATRQHVSLRLLLLLAGVTVLGAAKCPSSAKATTVTARAKKSALPDSADQVIFGGSTILTNQGVSNGHLLSDTMFVYDDGARLDLRRVNLTFYTSLGVKDGLLTSRTGTYNSRLSRLEARGDVVVVREDGKRLNTPQLVFDQARNQIFSDSTFTLIEPSRQLTGIGFESDPKFTNFKCLRACKIIASVRIPAK
jgi:LPS export ABC transporter protein LptC